MSESLKFKIIKELVGLCSEYGDVSGLIITDILLESSESNISEFNLEITKTVDICHVLRVNGYSVVPCINGLIVKIENSKEEPKTVLEKFKTEQLAEYYKQCLEVGSIKINLSSFGGIKIRNNNFVIDGYGSIMEKWEYLQWEIGEIKGRRAVWKPGMDLQWYRKRNFEIDFGIMESSEEICMICLMNDEKLYKMDCCSASYCKKCLINCYKKVKKDKCIQCSLANVKRRILDWGNYLGNSLESEDSLELEERKESESKERTLEERKDERKDERKEFDGDNLRFFRRPFVMSNFVGNNNLEGRPNSENQVDSVWNLPNDIRLEYIPDLGIVNMIGRSSNGRSYNQELIDLYSNSQNI
jgi:hypothetical protein